LQSLKDQIQGIKAAQSRSDADIAKLVRQSPTAKSEIQGLQNHVNTLRREPKAQKDETGGSFPSGISRSPLISAIPRNGPKGVATGYDR
jgi:hypothetical protein